MSQDVEKAMSDLKSNVSFSRGRGGGGGGSSSGNRNGSRPGSSAVRATTASATLTTRAACAGTIGSGLSFLGNVSSRNVFGALGSGTTMAAAATLCITGLRVGPTNTNEASKFFGA